MSNKQKDLLSEPTPDNAPPEELETVEGEVVNGDGVSGVPAVPDLGDDEKLRNAIEVAERYFAFTEAVKKMALARTRHHHWAKYPRGNEHIFYLTGEGATNLIKGFGVQITNQQSGKLWSDDELGRYYIWVYRADVFVPAFNLRIEGIEGRCSQRKAFFAKAGQEWKPASEIDEANIMADAQTDLWRNIIRRTFGIGYETEDTIAEAKVDTSKVAAPSFKKGGRKGGRFIKSNYDAKCAACGGPIKKGDEIFYDPKGAKGQKAYHSACAPSAEEEPEEAAAENGDELESLFKQIATLGKKHGLTAADLSAFVGDIFALAVKDLDVEQAKELITRLESGPEKGGFADYVAEGGGN
jgi:hypothetical protein